MKRGILILLFIFILACSVKAVTIHEVTFSPPDGQIFENEVPVSTLCTATVGADEELSNLTLYMKNNITEGEGAMEWQSKGFADDMPSGGSKTFSISGLVNGTYTWNCLAVSNNTNEEGEGNQEDWANSNWTFYITFTTAAPNTPPSWQQSTNQSTTEDSDTTLIINLDYDSSDTEDDALSQNMTYSISESASSIIDCSVSGAEMSCGPPAANQSGDNIVTVTATDSGDLTATIDYNISVMPVNDAPYLSKVISNQTWNENTNKTIDLDDYFSDVDDSSLNYSYDFTSTGTININVTIESDGDAKFTPEADWTGTETLTFTAYDTSNLSVTSNVVTLTVEEANATTGNSPPSIDSWLPETDPTISVGESQTFTITKSDPDGDDMNVTWYVDHVIKEGETGNSFAYTATTVGSFNIKVAVTDGEESVNYDWTLTVKETGTKTNKTVGPSPEEEPEEETFVCGDGVCDEGETTTSCCTDCGCPEGWECEDGKCRKERSSGNIILLIIIISLFVGGAGAGIYFYKKKQEQEIFGLAKTPFQAPPKEVATFKKPEVKPLQKPSVVVKEPAKKPLKTAKTTNQVLLKKFIIYNLRKGKSFEQIKRELLKVGWKEDQIQDAYTAAQLDEAFS